MMRGLGALALAIVVVGCASSRPEGTCDPNTTTCGEVVDAMPEADAPIDAPPGHEFGEPCTDNDDCESLLCILVGTSGQCTRTCSNDCPQGYGCVGVDGIAIDGEITFVCVPQSSQLCTTCTMDSECTLIGMDKCVTYPDGDRACARDCSVVGCPTGFDCENVVIDNVNYKQCMASSGACDCTAANTGATQQCNITTPWNVCLGTQTCAGATGWETCAPPSATDDPDATYTDQNCDGIDGDMTKGIFVSGAGSNSSTCGLTYQTPCATISHGIIRGVQTGRPNVFVQTGTYNEVVVLVNGVNVWGGYSATWQRGPYSNTAHRVTIVGAQDNGTGGSGEFMAVRAHGLIVPVTMADLIIQGPNATGVGGASGRDGRSSYGIHVDGAQVTLERVKIVGGNGAPGGAGSSGQDAVLVDAQGFMFGGGGGDGDEYNTACNSSSRGASGPAGTNSCSASPSTRAMNGGAGGRGGTMDTDCGVFSLNLNARSGETGQSASYAPFPFGYRGDAGGTCANAGFGNAGVIANGAAGGAVSGGYLTGGFWYARNGGSGGTGENGSGGGGGGGSGGCDDGTDAYGAGGGGGGAGGCAARGGGTGGGGGGASIGVFATNASTVMISGCDLTRGIGAAGGAGGAGGRGQSGGGGGGVGNHPGTGAGGVGGPGAHGGHGGGGAGGAGGRSVGLMWTPGSSVTNDCVIGGGSAGGGGAGGTSAPNAPLAERDGNNGATGAAGTLDATRACPNTTSC
ncbi:MAG: hypothetical protein AB7L94_22580 [Kofleriaceae bacterium]